MNTGPTTFGGAHEKTDISMDDILLSEEAAESLAFPIPIFAETAKIRAPSQDPALRGDRRRIERVVEGRQRYQRGPLSDCIVMPSSDMNGANIVGVDLGAIG